MNPKFVTEPAFTVVGLRMRTQPMTDAIPQLWQTLTERDAEIAHKAQPEVYFGLMQALDDEMSQINYMAGCKVTRVDELVDGLESWDVPAQTYAVFDATLPTLNETYDKIYTQWQPSAESEPLRTPFFERYGPDFDASVPDSKIEIFIPIPSHD